MKMQETKKLGEKRVAPLVLFWAALGASLMVNCLFSFNLGDETYYIAESLLVVQGGVPFYDMWAPYSGFSVVLAPFSKLFLWCTGSTEGIVLYTRIVSVLLRMLLCMIPAVALSPYVGRMRSHGMAGYLFWCLPYSIPVISYNSLYPLWNAVGCALLFCGMENRVCDPVRSRRQLFFSGVAFALSTYFYPSGVVLFFALAGALLCADIVGRRRLTGSSTLYLVAGGASAAAAVVLSAWIVHGYGPWQAVDGVRHVLSGIYHEIAADGYSFSPYFQPISGIKKAAPLLVAAVAATCAAFIGKRRKRRSAARGDALYTYGLAALTGIFFFALLASIYRIFSASIGGGYYIHFVLYLFPLLFAALPDWTHRPVKGLLLYIYLPTLFSLFAAALFAFDGTYRRWFMLPFGAALVIPLMAWSWEEASVPKWSGKIHRWAWICMFFLLTLEIGTDLYSAVFYQQEDITIQQGIFKGIRSSPGRAREVILLEQAIRQHTTPEESVLFLGYWNPAGYVMSNSQIASYCTLEPIYYVNDRKMVGLEVLMDAFDLRNGGELPDKMLCFGFEDGEKSFAMIDHPDYSLKPIIERSYRLVEESSGDLYKLRVYERIPGRFDG